MRFVILGCGRVGALVARELSQSNTVTVIDWNARSFDRLGDTYRGETVIGNGIDVDVLKSGGTATAAMFFALTDDDNRNLMAAEIATQLGVPRVVARVYDPVRSEAFRDMGIITVSPTILGADRLFDIVVAHEEA